MASMSAAASTDSLKLGIVMAGPQPGPNLVHCEFGRAGVDAALDRRAQPGELLFGRQCVPARLLVGAHYGLGLDIVGGLRGHGGIVAQVRAPTEAGTAAPPPPPAVPAPGPPAKWRT